MGTKAKQKPVKGAAGTPAVGDDDAKRTLARLRTRLDGIDDDVLRLLSERYEIIREVQRVKQRSGDGVYVPERERAQLARLARRNEALASPVNAEALRAIFGEILSASRALQAALSVAYLGPAGTYSEKAAREQFGASTTLVPAPSIGDVFRVVERCEAHYGIVPIENSTEGMVGATLDAFVASPLQIVAERDLAIRHALLSKAPSLRRVKRVVSHAQSLGQCRDWLRQNLPGVPTVDVPSNALAAQAAARGATTAAIASEENAERYGLRVLAHAIQDLPHNVTRFVVLGRPDAATVAGDADKVSLLFSVKNRPGMLFKSLKPLSERGIDLCKIESRPMRGRSWDYLFFLDFRGRLGDRRVAEAMAEMTRQCVWLKVLGAYAAALAS
ncbi:MAG: prephenate dehydratase [Deltaproteobacteria bacterium]|nr:prephenate dehydratase [Deltaproteobacteria bacterium]